MNPPDDVAVARWQRVQDLFHQVADQPRHVQQAAIQELGFEDSLAADELRAMLDADSAGASLLDRGVAQASNELLVDQTAVPRVPFGPYRAIRVLGAGGSGVVYLGHRADIDAHAAIKVLREAWLSPQRRERFHLEQRVLASLEHPSIARLLDADSLDDGTPWLALEYVEGQPLVEWVQSRALPLDRRVHLFLQICETVRFAHDRGVIHRDLKPANVLVNAEGQVKLLDFGIARWTARMPGDTTLTALRMLTPAYASPEQLRGAPADVQQDVYALGVMLFEVLTGERPHALPEWPREEAAAWLLQQGPPSVAQRLAHTEAGRLWSKAEWRDLDAVVATAMHPDDTRRYRSVEAFLRDLKAFVAREPVEARPDLPLERLGRFVRRRKRQILITSVITLGLAGILGAYTRGITAARDLARNEADRATRTTDFLVGLLNGGDDYSGAPDSLTVRDVVVRATRELPTLTRDAGLQADLYVLLGRIHAVQGDMATADSLLAIGEATERALHPPVNREALAAASLRAFLQTQRGEVDSALQRLHGVMAEAQRHFPDDPVALAGVEEALATVYAEKGQLEEATTMLERAVARFGQTDSLNKQYNSALTELSNVYFYRGLYDSSRVLNVRAAHLTELAMGRDNPSVAINLVNIGNIDAAQGRYASADSAFRRALRIMEIHHGPDHVRVAGVITQMTTPLIESGRIEEAKTLTERALRIHVKAYGENSPRLATTYNNLANIVGEMGDTEAALAYHRKGYSLYLRANGPDHRSTLITANNVAATLIEMQRPDEAATILEDVVARFRRGSAAPQDLAIAIIRLGQARYQQKRYRDAAGLGEEGLSMYENTVKEPTGVNRAAHRLMALAYDKLGDVAKANQHARDTLPPSR